VERTADFSARSAGPDDTAVIAEAIAAVLLPGDVLVLGGDMGAGKTTFTKALGAALGITETITSPTFTLHQQYEGGRFTLHHLDVYRIDQIEEVIDLALPELFESGGAVVIEWGDTIAPALPAGFALLSFGFGDGDDDRHISLTAIGSAWHMRVPGLKEVLADRLIDRQDDY
jgi:tRNA threonylcarbamoyladenosine biosynthesis protein TsaE